MTQNADLLLQNKPLLEAAKLLREQEHNQEALFLVKKALKKYPTDVETAILAGLLYQDMDQTILAEKSFRKAVLIDSNNPEALKSLGLFIITKYRKLAPILDQHKILEGVDYLIDYLQLTKWDDIAVLKIVINYLYEEKDRLALLLKEAWETTLSPEIGYLYAQRLKWWDEHESAISILQILERHSPTPEILDDLAEELTKLKKFELAIPLYQKAIDLMELALKKRPETLLDEHDDISIMLPEIYYNLSNCYRAYGKENLALKAATRSVQIDSDGKDYHKNGDYWNAKLEILLEMKNYQKAAEVAKQALEIKDTFGFGGPDEAHTFYLTLAKSFEMGGQPDEALKILTRQIKDSPEISDPYFEAGRILISLGRKDEAFSYFENMFQNTTEEIGERLYHLLAYVKYLREAGHGDSVWKRIYNLVKEEDKVIMGAIVLFSMRNELASNEGENAQKFIDQTIDYISENLADLPLEIESVLEVRFQQGRLDDCVDILNQALKISLPDDFRLAFLNNLGYAQLCKGNFREAKKALSRALALAIEKPNLGTPFTLVGMAFFLDDEVIPYTWINRSKVKSDPFNPFGKLNGIYAVKANMVTLALAKGDADEATLLAADILSTFTNKSSYALRDLVLLFLARFRSDVKTARFAWNQYLEHKEEIESIIKFKKLYPEFYKWINPSKAQGEK